jgi:hypothetical protein
MEEAACLLLQILRSLRSNSRGVAGTAVHCIGGRVGEHVTRDRELPRQELGDAVAKLHVTVSQDDQQI